MTKWLEVRMAIDINSSVVKLFHQPPLLVKKHNSPLKAINNNNI